MRLLYFIPLINEANTIQLTSLGHVWFIRHIPVHVTHYVLIQGHS